MIRFYDNVTPLNAENLNELVDVVSAAENKVSIAFSKSEDAIQRADYAIQHANSIFVMFNEFVKIFGNPITADEFSKKDLSAQEFDNKELTAIRFDTIGKTLL